MSKITEEKIKELLSKYGRKPENITLDTTLQSLNMVSEDIDDFFNDFASTFNVDGKGYNYYDFFFEDVHPLHVIRDVFYRVFNPEKVKKKKLTIRHLVSVAERGKWFDPEL